MFNNISEILERPKIYTQSDMDFWDDEHISKQMLLDIRLQELIFQNGQ